MKNVLLLKIQLTYHYHVFQKINHFIYASGIFKTARYYICVFVYFYCEMIHVQKSSENLWAMRSLIMKNQTPWTSPSSRNCTWPASEGPPLPHPGSLPTTISLFTLQAAQMFIIITSLPSQHHLQTLSFSLACFVCLMVFFDEQKF